MESFLFYIGKAAFATGAFYICYLLLFQNQKQFVFNRFYLLASFAISLLLPLLTFTVIREIEQPVFPIVAQAPLPEFPSYNFESPGTMPTMPENSYSWFHYAILIYLVGIIGFIIHLIIGYIRALSIIGKSEKQWLCNSEVYVTSEDVHPFSFFNKTVISKNTINHPNVAVIIEHERIHSEEKHTIDILMAELLFILQWFNPFAWLLKDAIKNNLEYKTDCKVIQSANPESYQLTMVSLADKKGVAPFLNALNGSQLKNRIIMMKKQTHNKHKWRRQLVIIPILIVLGTTLSGREYVTKIVEAKINPLIVIDGNKIPKDDKRLESIDFTNSFYVAEVLDALHIDNDKLEYSDFIVDNKIADEIFREESKNGILLLKTYSYIKGMSKKFDMLIQESERLSNNRTNSIVLGDTTYNIQPEPLLISEKDKGSSNKFQIRGKVTSKKTGEPLPGVLIKSSNKVGSITDVEGNYSIEVERADNILSFSRYNMIEQKINIDSKEEINILMEETKIIKPEPLILVDDKEITWEEFTIFEATHPDIIESVSILKNLDATSKYGEKAENGVIIITTKSYQKEDEKSELNILPKDTTSPIVVKIDDKATVGSSLKEGKNKSNLFGAKNSQPDSLKKARITGYGSHVLLKNKLFVTGIVTDEAGDPIPLIRVQYNNNLIVKSTDVTGYYQVAVDSLDGKLTFSQHNWETKKVDINGRAKVDVTLKRDNADEAPDHFLGEYKVRGKVIDKLGDPIKGVDIYSIRSGSKGGSTDENGEFSLQLNQSNSMLIFLKVGFNQEEILVKFDDDEIKEKSIRVEMETKDLSTSNNPFKLEPLYILEGKPISSNEMNKLDPNTIKSINVLKGKNATNLYGSRAAAGALVISLKGKNYVPPLYILNGKEVSQDSINNLDRNSIKNFKFLKGEEAINKYGEKAKSGAVEYELKEKKPTIKNTIIKVSTVETKQAEINRLSKNTDCELKVVLDFDTGKYVIRKPIDNPSPLYIIDGEIATEKQFEELTQQQIADIFIWEEEAAIATYGEKGKPGVVKVSTKEN